MNLKTASLCVVIVMAIEWTSFGQNASVKGSYQSKTSIEADESFESALLSSENGDSKSARLQLERAMDLWIRTHEPGKAAQAAVQLGDRYRNRKEYQAALSLYHLANNVKSISAPIKANALNAVARTYEDLFVDDLAEHYFNQALLQEVSINDPSSKVVSLTGLAGIYRRRGLLDKAAALITQALGLAKRTDVTKNAALLYLKGDVCQSTRIEPMVLTPGTDADEDGFLEVGEISELDLDCELVVLSGCQTGRGQLLTGEGMVGLSRAFMYAGAKSLVVSFWNVSDISTCHLMESFYSHLTTGMSIAAALRETKLQMLKSDDETRHPYYWASFITIGKP